MPTLEDAITLAAQSHCGQVDKGGEPYILHPIRVMLNLDSADERIVAILHDIIEDTTVTLQQLEQMGYSASVVAAVSAMTHERGETYQDYIERVCRNSLAIKVKINDLKDNLNPKRLSKITERDRERMKRYNSTLEKLMDIAEPNTKGADEI